MSSFPIFLQFIISIIIMIIILHNIFLSQFCHGYGLWSGFLIMCLNHVYCKCDDLYEKRDLKLRIYISANLR